MCNYYNLHTLWAFLRGLVGLEVTRVHSNAPHRGPGMRSSNLDHVHAEKRHS